MKHSVTFRTDLNISIVSSVLCCNKSELIDFLLTTKHDFYEVLMFSNGVDSVVNGTNQPCAWYYFEGKHFNLGSVPYRYWKEFSSYPFSERLNLCLYKIEGYLIELSKEVEK